VQRSQQEQDEQSNTNYHRPQGSDLCASATKRVAVCICISTIPFTIKNEHPGASSIHQEQYYGCAHAMGDSSRHFRDPPHPSKRICHHTRTQNWKKKQHNPSRRDTAFVHTSPCTTDSLVVCLTGKNIHCRRGTRNNNTPCRQQPWSWY
jgi:hypothetical protein